MFENRLFLLYPIVKNMIMIAAWLIFACCGVAVLGVLIETVAYLAVLFASTESAFGALSTVGIWAFVTVQIAIETAIILIALISPWCCRVLLGGSGNEIVRAFSFVNMWVALIILFEKVSRRCIGMVYFSDTDLFPLFLAFMCASVIFASAPFYHAASGRLRWCLYATAGMMMLNAILDSPYMWMFHHDVPALLLGLFMAYPAFLLARTAPLIVSLPSDKD